MLSTLRHKGVAKKILWVVAVIIILSFGVFGTAYRLDHSVNSAGKVNGHSVPLRDFERAYLDSRDQAILMYGDRFFKMGGNLDFEREAWDRLIIQDEVKKRKIDVSDKEVVEFIANIPFFQSQGKFDQRTYEMIVRNRSVFDRKTKDFENGIRSSLAIRKLFATIGDTGIITEEELKKEYIKRNEKIKLTYVLFAPSDYDKGLAASDEEAKTFYEAHMESFRVPPTINAQYVHLMYPDKATDEQKAVVKKMATEIAHELTPKSDFAAIAYKFKQQTKDSGPFTQDQPLLTFAWSPEFVDQLFAMKQGEISNPMEAPDGWQIVKIKEKKDAHVPELTEIKDKVKDAVILEKSLKAATAKAEETLALVREQVKTKDFKATIEGLNFKTDETAPFSRGEYINAPGLVGEFQETSFKLNEQNKLSGIVNTSQGPAIVYLHTVEPIDEKKYGEDKGEFKQMLSAQKSNQAISVFVNKLKLSANIQPNLKGKIRYK